MAWRGENEDGARAATYKENSGKECTMAMASGF